MIMHLIVAPSLARKSDKTLTALCVGAVATTVSGSRSDSSLAVSSVFPVPAWPARIESFTTLREALSILSACCWLSVKAGSGLVAIARHSHNLRTEQALSWLRLTHRAGGFIPPAPPHLNYMLRRPVSVAQHPSRVVFTSCADRVGYQLNPLNLKLGETLTQVLECVRLSTNVPAYEGATFDHTVTYDAVEESTSGELWLVGRPPCLYF
jgi:hypothetical protein